MLLVDAFHAAGDGVQVDVGPGLVARPALGRLAFAPEHDVGVELPLDFDLGGHGLAGDQFLLIEERLVVVDQVVVQNEIVVEPAFVLPGDDVADFLVFQAAVGS